MESTTSSVLELPLSLSSRMRKHRYNVSLYPDDVRRMDELARHLGISRSELITFACNRLAADCKAGGVI